MNPSSGAARVRFYWGPAAVRWLLAAVVAAVAPWGLAKGGSYTGVRRSVFKIHTNASEPSMLEPWKVQGASASSGTGFYIGGGRILTNAHVVAHASFVTVQRDGDSRPVPARVKFIAHDCDLALLEPVEPALLNQVPALALGSVPKLRSPVSTIGYPLGGEQLSITDGIVSRVSYQRYAHHGSARHLLVQVDSAINPGNSGGPVVQGHLVVGVAFQSYTQAENTGYIIPTPVIRRFLRDVENDHYEGHPDDGLTTTNWAMLNPSTMAFHDLTADHGGVKIAHVASWAPTAKLLEPGDIILAIDGQPIGVDGKVNFEGERVDFRAIFDLKLMGDKASFRISRGGMIQTVVVPIEPAGRHVAPEHVFSHHTRYIVWGGLVFTSLSHSLVRSFGDRWWRDAPLLLRYLEYYSRFEPDVAKSAEILVLAKRLPDAVNTYATANSFGVVRAVGERPITRLEDLIAALETDTGEFAVIHFMGSDDPLVLSRAAVKERNAVINKKYGVEPDRWLKGKEDDGALSASEEAS